MYQGHINCPAIKKWGKNTEEMKCIFIHIYYRQRCAKKGSRIENYEKKLYKKMIYDFILDMYNYLLG